MRGLLRLLLPQVPMEQGWDREVFVAQTCVKAGLPADAWHRGARLLVFEAEVFGEREPISSMFLAATSGSVRWLMKACASSTFFAVLGMHMSSQEKGAPSFGTKVLMSWFSLLAWIRSLA